MPGRRLAAILALALLLTACTAGGDADDDPEKPTGPDSSDPALAAEDAAVERAIGERLTEGGAVPLDLGLDLFAAGYGPIDGGDPHALPSNRIPGEIAVRGLVGHWDELTAAQRATVTEALALSDVVPVDRASGPVGTTGVGASGGTRPGTAAPGGPVALAAVPTGADADEPIPGVMALVRAATAEVGSRLGRTLSVPVTVSAGDVPDNPAWGAVTTPIVGGVPVHAGRMDACHITFYPLTRNISRTPGFRSAVVHEVFHCFQYDAVDAAEVYDGPIWVVEGSADFVHGSLAPSTQWPPHWEAWLTEPWEPLTRRVYAGLGAFAVAEQTGVDVWELLLPLLELGHHQALERLFGTSADAALTAIAQALVREPGLGAAWESTGPAIPPGARGTVVRDLPQGVTAQLELRIRPYATAPHAVDFSGEVLDVQVTGAIGRIGLPGGVTEQVTDGFVGRWCVSGFCECADGTDLGATEIPSDGVVGLGLASTGAALLASTPPGILTLTSRTTADACAHPMAAPVTIVRFASPEPFEVHGGHCLVQDDGALLIQAGDHRYPEGYEPPDAHRDDVTISIYVNPASPPDHGSVFLRIGEADVATGGSHLVVAPDHLSGTFSLGSGYTGEWVCAELTPAGEFSG